MTHVSAPGKLMIAGEWSVLEPGNPCIVAAVDKRVHAEVHKSDKLVIELKDFNKKTTGSFIGGGIKWDSDDKVFAFAKAAVETTLKFLGKTEAFRLVTYGSSDMEINGAKLGFGSSAAAIVAMNHAILRFFSYDDAKFTVKLYKLGTIANYIAQGKVGSSFDIAASVYGNVLVYERFDPKWLDVAMVAKNIADIVSEKWPGFRAKPMEIPRGLKLLVAYSGKPASTTGMIEKMKQFKVKNAEEYVRIVSDITSIVQLLTVKWTDNAAVMRAIKDNRQKLSELTQLSGVPVETEELKEMARLADEAGGAGKLSGAGGGDCGIALCFNSVVEKKIKQAWKKAGFPIIDVEIGEGSREE